MFLTFGPTQILIYIVDQKRKKTLKGGVKFVWDDSSWVQKIKLLN